MDGHGLRFDGGRVCLDLVGTRAGRAAEERLGSGERLRAWLHGTGLVPLGTAVEPQEAWLPRFLALRAVLDRIVRAALDGDEPAAGDLAELNAAALAAPPAPRAVPGQKGTLTRALAVPPDCDALVAAVARDAVDLLTDPAARSRLRACEGENCTVVYLDTSRGRRRRWCSSEVCGNRERVARHRRRNGAATHRM